MALSWSFPPFRLDLGTGSLWRDEALVPLPPKPFAVLVTLVAQAGQVVSQEAIGSGAPSPLVAMSISRFVGREAELAQLRQCWAQVCQGQRQRVFVTGEAGIGKTTLVDAFVAQLVDTEIVWSARGQCIEHYGAGEAYLPLLEALGQLGRGPDGGSW